MNAPARRLVLALSLGLVAPAAAVAHAAPAHADALPVLHVIDAAGARVVIDTAPEPTWGRGAPVMVSAGHPAVARRAVDPRALPPRLASRAGERVRLFDARGVRCEATLGEFALVGRAEVHFGMRAAWEGDESSGRTAPMTPAEIAQDLWSLEDGSLGLALTAAVHPVSGDCTGARWAMPASEAAPAVAAVEPADAATRTAALARFRALPAWRAAQRSYLASEVDGRHARRWDEHGTSRPEVLVVRGAPGAAPRVWVAAHVGSGGCGGFEGDLSALLEARASASSGAHPGALSPVWTSTSAQVGTPRAALGGADGAVELLFDEARLAPASEGYQYDALSVPYLDCPC